MRDELIILERAQDIQEVIVYNINGARVSSAKSNRIDTRALPAGIYTVQLRMSNGETMMGKVVKE